MKEKNSKDKGVNDEPPKLRQPSKIHPDCSLRDEIRRANLRRGRLGERGKFGGYFGGDDWQSAFDENPEFDGDPE